MEALSTLSFLSPPSPNPLPIQNPPTQITFSSSSLSLPSPPALSQSIRFRNGLVPVIPHESCHQFSLSSDLLSVVCPSLAFANTVFFKSAYNVQVIVGENEPEEKLIARFRREVFKAGVIQECKRRRFFETKQEERKRRVRDAARRNRRRRPPPKSPKQENKGAPKKKAYEEGDDNWDFLDVELPYC